MIDLETMGNTVGCPIVSIGAVACNLVTGEISDEYYRVVDLRGQEEWGLSINTDTLYWWLQQSDGARNALCQVNKLLLPEMCNSFSKWIYNIESSGEKLRMWSNGASFDIPILRYAYYVLGEEFPTKFWNDRDMRTIVGFYPYQLLTEWKRYNIRKGTHHNALADAKHQVKLCSHILQELGVEELY